MKIKIINISDSDKHFDTAIKEYQKRLGQIVQFVNIKPEKNWEKDKIIKNDTLNIIDFLQKDTNYKVFLSKEWKALNSLEFADLIKINYNISFVIWWAYGLDEQMIQKFINNKLSFWNITFPHWLAKLVLLEQIYRWIQINENKKYHY